MSVESIVAQINARTQARANAHAQARLEREILSRTIPRHRSAAIRSQSHYLEGTADWEFQSFRWHWLEARKPGCTRTQGADGGRTIPFLSAAAIALSAKSSGLLRRCLRRLLCRLHQVFPTTPHHLRHHRADHVEPLDNPAPPSGPQATGATQTSSWNGKFQAHGYQGLIPGTSRNRSKPPLQSTANDTQHP